MFLFTNSIKVTPKTKIDEDLEKLEDKYILLNAVIWEVMFEGFLCHSLEKIFNKASIDQIIALADNCKKSDNKNIDIRKVINKFIQNQLSGIPTYETSSINSDNESKKIVEKLIDNLEKTNYLSTNIFFREDMYKSLALEKEMRTQFLKTLCK